MKKTTARKTSKKKKTAKKKTAARAKATKKAVKKAKKVLKKKVLKKKPTAKKTTKKAVAKKTTKKVPAATVAKKKAPVSKGTAGAKAGEPESPPPPPLISIEEALANLPFREGDHVVHPKYGLGQVVRLVERQLTLRTVPCLEIHFSHQDMKLTIPVDHLDRSGLRNPMTRKTTADVFETLRGRATFDAKRRSAKRVADYQKRVRQGDPLSMAEVVRDLSRLSLKKALSYEERKILSEALRILSREVALARGKDPDEVQGEIEDIVNR